MPTFLWPLKITTFVAQTAVFGQMVIFSSHELKQGAKLIGRPYQQKSDIETKKILAKGDCQQKLHGV